MWRWLSESSAMGKISSVLSAGSLRANTVSDTDSRSDSGPRHDDPHIPDAVVPADLASVFESVTTTAVGNPTLESGTFPPTTGSPTQMPTAVRRSNITVPLNYTFDGVDGRCASFVKAVSTAAHLHVEIPA